MFEKTSFYKKRVRFKQTSLSSTQFHPCTDYKELRPLKLEKSRFIRKWFRLTLKIGFLNTGSCCTPVDYKNITRQIVPFDSCIPLRIKEIKVAYFINRPVSTPAG